ncbi:MAG: hypothetical protein N2112_10875 [Gemmataceae bacterium]|nr:hypothetical protein [Gemmataceae bacterium]
MKQNFLDVAILTEDRYVHVSQPDWYVGNILREEGLLAQHLTARGLSCRRISWADPTFDWSSVRVCVFRSTWDYFERFREFSAWMERIATVTRFINSAELIRWNWNKKYLLELNHQGIPIPKTILFSQGEKPALRENMKQQGWQQAIFKPVISGAGRHTYLLQENQIESLEPRLHQLLETEDFLLQEFLSGILEVGEISLIVIDGEYTHAVRKIGKPGDFRVHDDHGGSVHPYQATPEEKAWAEKIVQACPEIPLYARVDLVRDQLDNLKLMELELIEPELFFRFHEPAAEKLAIHIYQKIQQCHWSP